MREVLSKPLYVIAEFIRLESSAGILLFITAILALIIDNSPLHGLYQTWMYGTFLWKIGPINAHLSTVFVVNDILMPFFFLLVGLEMKREMCEGELGSASKIALPAISALGGMIVPAIVYIAFNHTDAIAVKGWAIPTATDIAFALGILALLGKRVPVALKVYLMSLAIFDDLGAILIITFFYATHFSELAFIGILVCLSVLIACNAFGIQKLSIYGVLGVALWACFLFSGIHPTLAGVALALTIPLKSRSPQKRGALHSPLRYLETRLHPWVAYCILPIFSFANAGVSFSGLQGAHLFGNIPLGILLGLFLGKQIGIFGTAWAAIRLGIAALPRDTNLGSMYAAAMICGVGFTMSLFIGNLAFSGAGTEYAIFVRFGVLSGSLLSGTLGYLLLRVCNKKPH